MNCLSNLITLPDPRLRQKSQKVHGITEDIIQLVQKMEQTVLEWEETRPHEIGAALSAVQIAEPYRVIIIRQDFDDKDNQSFLALVNPEIVKHEGRIEDDYEGCLSVTDIYGLVSRHSKVRVRAMGLKNLN